jgi:hypothetical protein
MISSQSLPGPEPAQPAAGDLSGPARLAHLAHRTWQTGLALLVAEAAGGGYSQTGTGHACDALPGRRAASYDDRHLYDVQAEDEEDTDDDEEYEDEPMKGVRRNDQGKAVVGGGMSVEELARINQQRMGLGLPGYYADRPGHGATQNAAAADDILDTPAFDWRGVVAYHNGTRRRRVQADRDAARLRNLTANKDLDPYDGALEDDPTFLPEPRLTF